MTDQYFLAKNTANTKNKTPTITNNKSPTKSEIAEFKTENKNMHPKTDKKIKTLVTALCLETIILNKTTSIPDFSLKQFLASINTKRIIYLQFISFLHASNCLH